jgi:hypothetical protein
MPTFHNVFEKAFAHNDAVHVMTGWWFGTFFIFPYLGNVIIPFDEVIFFRGVGQPTTNQIIMNHH